MEKCNCKKCGYSWMPRKIKPRCCPLCKSYEWNTDKKVSFKNKGRGYGYNKIANIKGRNKDGTLKLGHSSPMEMT